MAEYIKRDAALKALCQVSAPTPDESHIVEKCIEKIYRMPMMEVVRCEDCKHCNDVYGKKVCTKGINWRAVEPKHFCSYGERGEGE